MLRARSGAVRGLAGAALALAMALAGPAPRAAAAEDPYWASSGAWGQDGRDQWALAHVGWSPELAARARAPVTVAIVDTGLDYHHPDLRADALLSNEREILNGVDDDANGYVDDLVGWSFVDGTPNPWDQAGHGTIVAGILAAATGNGEGIAGMHPRVRILPLRALHFAGRGRSSAVAEAVYYAVSRGARVVNLSLGGESISIAERRAIEYAERKGVLVVVAAGNEGRDVAGLGPASLPNVLTVGASTPADEPASFSNFGARLDLLAPGVDVLSLRARRTDVPLVAGLAGYAPGSSFVGPGARYARVSGTSFAAPFVSGAAALLLSARPELTAAEVRRMLLQSARDVGTPGVDPRSGYGVLDLRAAMDADPRLFVEARIDGVSVDASGGAPVVKVSGTLDASDFAEGFLELGAGAAPASWKRVGAPVARPVRGGVLGEIPGAELAGEKTWTVRARARHASGREREGRFQLVLGGS